MIKKSLHRSTFYFDCCLQNGHNAVGVSVAEKYIHAFEQLAKEGNTILLPSNTGDVSNMVAQVGTWRNYAIYDCDLEVLIHAK